MYDLFIPYIRIDPALYHEYISQYEKHSKIDPATPNIRVDDGAMREEDSSSEENPPPSSHKWSAGEANHLPLMIRVTPDTSMEQVCYHICLFSSTYILQ